MVLTALTFIAILSILVLVHELGHFMVARFFGVRVDEFGFGLPPRITGKKIRGTLYSLNWLPVGGFVKLAGEDEEDTDRAKLKKEPKGVRNQYFWAKSRFERVCILLAGVAMNFLLAVGITAFLLTRGIVEPTTIVHIEKVSVGSPAEKIGLRAGDVVSSISFSEKGKIVTKELEDPGVLI